MLHPDSTRRIADIENMAKLFREKGYQKTANRILTFVEILKTDEIPTDFLKRLDLIFNLFRGEFIGKLPVGQDFRKRCFDEIGRTIFRAIRRTHPTFNQAILVIYPFLKTLNKGIGVTGSIAEGLGHQAIKDKNLTFHLYCYAYLVTIEGVFDELARILYFFTVVSKSNVPTIQHLRKMTVWRVLRSFKTPPVFLEGWNEKNHIRNAIGHARVYYDSASDKVRFVNIRPKTGKVVYDRTLSTAEFWEMALELEDSVQAFLHAMLLVRLYDLVASPNPYQ